MFAAKGQAAMVDRRGSGIACKMSQMFSSQDPPVGLGVRVFVDRWIQSNERASLAWQCDMVWIAPGYRIPFGKPGLHL